MSDPTQDDGKGEVIPVEVVPPDDPAPADADVAAPVDPTAELQQKLVAAEAKTKENYDKFLRAMADLENQRKRSKREVEEVKFDAKNRIMKEMLPVVDNLERAIEHAASAAGELDGAVKPIVEGVQLVLRQFQTAFERLDIQVIEAKGQPFDPNLHEAISQLESEEPPGTVVQVLQRGYKSGDKLLRPALVVVAKAKAPVNE